MQPQESRSQDSRPADSRSGQDQRFRQDEQTSRAGHPVSDPGPNQGQAPRQGPAPAIAAPATAAPAQPKRSPRIQGIDGLRGLAAIAVLLYHMGFSWANGGYQGVTVFFVLSGYFITRSLDRELNRTGTVNFKEFLLRRLHRLLPSMVVLTLVTAALCTIANHVMLTKMRSEILPALLFFENWWQVINDVSYFDAVGDPSPLTHLWFVAVEMQLYLVWAIALWAARRVGASNRTIRRVALVAAAVSAVAMAALYDPAADTTRIYYGTDTRAFSFLMGAWLALLPAGSVERLADDSRTVTAFEAAGAVGLLGLALVVVLTNDYTAFQYRGGTVLVSVLALVVLAACLVPGSRLERALSVRPLVWLGSRSYSIYLWHYPLLCLMNPSSNVGGRSWWMSILQVAVVLVVAEVSYRLVEEPFRNGLGAWLDARAQKRAAAEGLGVQLRSAKPRKRSAGELVLRYAPAVLVLAVVLTAAGGLIFVEDTSALDEEGAALLQGDDVGGTDELADEAAVEAAEKEEEEETEGYAYDVLMIGDSVSLRAEDVFYETFPDGRIDAAKNRQFEGGIEAFDWYEQEGYTAPIIVIALGTNGPVDDEMVDELMDGVKDDQTVVFINTRSTTSWVTSTNTALSNAASRYDNVRLIDWYSYSSGRSDLFDGDGTHLSASGSEEYVQLIYNAVADILPEDEPDEGADAADGSEAADGEDAGTGDDGAADGSDEGAEAST